MPGVPHLSLEGIGPVVVENEPKYAWGGLPIMGDRMGRVKKSTFAIAVQTPPNFNTFEEHMVGVSHFNLERIGPVVVENDSCKVENRK